MIWIFLILAAAAIALTVLGALSVWVAVLALALKALLVVPVVFAMYLLWQKFYGRQA